MNTNERVGAACGQRLRSLMSGRRSVHLLATEIPRPLHSVSKNDQSMKTSSNSGTELRTTDDADDTDAETLPPEAAGTRPVRRDEYQSESLPYPCPSAPSAVTNSVLRVRRAAGPGFQLGLLLLWSTVAGLAAVPTINSFTPMSGPTGAVVTITGANFGATAGENIVWFGAVRATMLSFGSAKCSQYPIT